MDRGWIQGSRGGSRPWAPPHQIGVQIRVCSYRESSRILVEIRGRTSSKGGVSRGPYPRQIGVLGHPPQIGVQIGVVPERESSRILVEIRGGSSSNRGVSRGRLRTGSQPLGPNPDPRLSIGEIPRITVPQLVRYRDPGLSNRA